jgi:hypothetical protein
MLKKSILFGSMCVAALPVLAADKAAAASPPAGPRITYQEHILPVFRNSCLNCHNPDKKKGDLDLSTYTGLAAGGGGGKVFNPGDPDGSKLYKAVTWAEEPNMPPKGDKLSAKDLDLIKQWIAGGAPENNGSTVVINKPKVSLGVVVAAGKPAGPIAMPKGLPIEPVVTPRHMSALASIAASPWAPVIAVSGQRQIVLYHADTLEILGVLAYPEGIAYSLKFSRNGSLLLAGGGIGAKTGKVVAFDVATGKRVTEVGDEFDAVIASDISPDQSQVALGTPLKTIKIYNTADGSLEHSIKKHTDWVQAVAYSPDGKYLATGDRAGNLVVWEAKTAREVYSLAGHKEAITDAAFRSDSKLLASASQDGTVKLWNMDEGTLAKSITAHAGGVLGLEFAQDGRIVTCGRDHLVKVWGADGAAIRSFEPFADIALRATFSADGNRVFAGDYTGAIRAWTVADGKRVGELAANPPTVAQQLAGMEQRIKDAAAGVDKANAGLKAARDAQTAAANDLKAANDAQAAHAKAVETTTAKLASAKADVTNQAKAAAASLPAKQQAIDKAKADHAKAKAALAAGQAAAAKPADPKADPKAAAATKPDVKALTAALAKADADLKAATAALAAAKAESKLTAETSPQVAAAKAALAKAKTDADAATKALPAKQAAAQAANEKVAKAEADAKSAAQLAESTKAQKTRLEAMSKQPPAGTKVSTTKG